MSDDERHLPQSVEDVAELMNNLTFDPPPTPQQAAELLASLPPEGTPVMVVRSLRLPMDVDDAVAAAAKADGVTKTAWIRQAIEMALSLQTGDDQPISRADALRALTLLRPVRRVA